jgi:hypothetical protein
MIHLCTIEGILFITDVLLPFITAAVYSLVVFNQYLMLPQSSGIKRKNLFIIYIPEEFDG